MSRGSIDPVRRRGACEVIKRGKRFVRKHVGTDNAMSVMALRRAMGQTLRHMVELNHRSEVHYMLVAYDPRNENPSLTYYGSRDMIRAALRSSLKLEIVQENLPKQLHKNTIRVPVFSPRDASDLEDMAEQEREENALTLYFYKEMQRCTFPMHFFKIKANDSWIPRRNVAFWPADLEVHTLHESAFGRRTNENPGEAMNLGTRFLDRTDCLLYMLQYIKHYYHEVVLKSLQLKMISGGDEGFAFINADDFTEEEVERATEIVNRELCARMFVSWILNPLRPNDDEKMRRGHGETIDEEMDEEEDGEETEETLHSSLHHQEDPHGNVEDLLENDDIDVCGTDENRTNARHLKSHPRKDNQTPSTSTADSWMPVKDLNEPVPGGETRTVLIAGKRVTMRKVSSLPIHPHRLDPKPNTSQKPALTPFRFIKMPSSRLFSSEMRVLGAPKRLYPVSPRHQMAKRPPPAPTIPTYLDHRGQFALAAPFDQIDVFHDGEVVLEETVSTIGEEEMAVEVEEMVYPTTQSTWTQSRFAPHR